LEIQHISDGNVCAAEVSPRSPDLRKCTACKQLFPLSNFYHKQHRCKSCDKKGARAWALAHPERVRELSRKHGPIWRRNNRLKANLSTLRLKARLRGHAPPSDPTREMPAACEACGAKENPLRLDHCHKSGKFRGWLCNKCNLAIGLLGDSVPRLVAAARYLRRHR